MTIKRSAGFFLAALALAALPATRSLAACVDCGSVFDVRTVTVKGDSSGAGAVLGGIAGGVLGHQVGSGRGNDVATAAGAIGGGVIGNRIDNRDEAPSGDARCRTVSDSGSDVVAYDVRYEYRGREFTTRLDHDPGRWLDVGRDIRADGYPVDASVAADPDRGNWR